MNDNTTGGVSRLNELTDAAARSLVRSFRGEGQSARLLVLFYVLAAVGIVGLLVVGTGGDLAVALGGWFRGAFGTGYNTVQTLSYATPLVLVAIGVAAALKAGVITVGAEGQMLVGATTATVVALWLGPAVPLWLGLPIGALAGMLGGAAWAYLPGLGRVRWGVNEVLCTLLGNYLAIYLLNYLLRTVLRNPAGSATPQSAPLPDGFLLPQLPLPARLHIGAILVVVLVLLALWWSRGRGAFLIGVYGQRPLLAARLGLTPSRAVVSTMLVSGAAAGLAGWMQLAGVDGRLQPGVSAGVGFAGIAVAVLGRGNPLGIVVAAIAYASLTTGATGVQVATGTTPAAIGTVTQGVLLFAAALIVAAPAVRRASRRPAPPTRPPASGSAADRNADRHENTDRHENLESAHGTA
jgi:ABC-type uncharacterized transport system permease subunit